MSDSQRDGDADTDLTGDGIAGEIVPGDRATDETTAAALARLVEPDLSMGERRQLLGQVAQALGQRGIREFLRGRSALMSWLTDVMVDVAPRVTVRDLATLRAHFPGLADGEIADRLVRNATRATAAIGAVGGGVTAIQWAAPPALLSAPVVLAAETVAVVAVELKLIGELQELHGQPVPGPAVAKAVTLLQAWAGRRGVNLLVPGRGMAVVLGTAARHQLRDQLIKRFGRNLTALGPFLTGAAVAALLNRRATSHLAEAVRKDLLSQRS